MLLVRTLCRRAPARRNVPRTQVHVSPLRVSTPASQRLLSSHLARIAALGIQECVSGHSIHFTHTHRRDARKVGKAVPLPATNTANERLCKALHHAERYFASCRAQVRSSTDSSSSVNLLMPVMVRVEASTTGAHRVRTLRDVAEDTLDEDQEDEVRTVHSSTHYEDDDIALPCLDPTYAERSQARLHVLLQQWVSYAAMRVTPSDFTRYQSRIAALLVPRKQPSLLLSSQPHLMHSAPQDCGSSSNSTSASELLWQALVRRGAKSYIELLQRHAAQPQSAAEWRHLCDILCCMKSDKESTNSEAKIHAGTTSGQYNSVPLLPSGMSSVTSITKHASLGTESQVRSSLHPLSAWALLAEMTTAAECVALLRWSRLWAPTCALWTRDVAHVWQRCRFALTNEESVDCDASTQATLVQWWQEACRTEQCGQDGGSSIAVLTASPHRNGLSGAAAALQRHVSATCVHEKSDESAALSSSMSATTPDGVRYRNELVLRGAWRELLDSVHQHALHSAMKSAKETHIMSGNDVMSYVRARLPGLGALFNARRDTAVKTKIVTHARSLLARTRVNARRDKAHTMRHALPPSLASAPTTSEEVELALRPVLPSLQLHLTMAEQNALRTLTSTTNPPPPAAIVELRRRLWALACTPAYLPRTLVHLEGTALWRSGAKHHTNSNKANSVRLPLPYLKRLPAKELLPWLLVAAIGAAVELAVVPLVQSTQTATHHHGMTSVQEGWQSAVHALLSDVHANVMRSLCNNQPSYAAAAEYTASFCITSGMSIAEAVILEYLKGNRDVAMTQVTPAVQSEMWQRAESVLVAAVDVFFRPTSTTTAVCSWSGLTRTATSNGNANVVSLTPTHVDWLLHKCLSSERNYRVSLYFETLAQVAPSAGPLLRAYAQEVQAYGVPLLSPEAAASLTTALSLHDLNHYCNNNSCESKRYREAVLQACGPWLFFVIPADKSPAHYFRAMTHSDYLVDCVTQAPQNEEPGTTSAAASITLDAKWPRSVAALLACRTLRRLERYPTSTVEPFFHLRPTLVKGGKGHAWNCTMQVPQLTLRLCAVDLVALFAHADTQHQGEKKEVTIQTSNSSNDDDCDGRTMRRPVQELPCVVARDLPYGLAAVYKPAHVNPTLHAHYDSLPFFLARHLPWRTTGPVQPNSTHSSVAQSETTPTHLLSSSGIDVKCVPVWHQHGLLNRLDRGTSGLMLVADTSAALHAARHASLQGHVLRKSYRALVQYVAPRPAAAWAAQSLWYLPLRGVVHGAIHAEGSSAATLHSLRPNVSYHTSDTDEDDMEGSEVELPAASAPRLPTALLDRRVAHSEFHLLEVFPKAGVYYVEVRLWAGKRHQIRQHFARIGHPLLGDVLYHPQCAELVQRCRTHSTGATLEAECEAALAAQCFGLTRPALHAHEIRIVQPASHDTEMTGDDERDGEAKVTVVRCALPQDMREALERLRSQR